MISTTDQTAKPQNSCSPSKPQVKNPTRGSVRLVGGGTIGIGGRCSVSIGGTGSSIVIAVVVIAGISRWSPVRIICKLKDI